MNPLKTLLRHSSHYMGGRAALMLLGFISFPVFTRALSVAEYGTLNLIQQTVLLLTVLAKFGFQHAAQRYYPEHAKSGDPMAVRSYYSTLFLGTLIIGCILVGAFLGTVPLGVGRFFGIAASGTLVLASSLIVIRSLRAMQLNLMQMENKTRLFNGMEIFQKAATVGLTIVLLFYWSRSVMACFLAMLVVEAAVVLQYVFVLARRGLVSPTLFDSGFLRSAVVYSVPLMIAEISWVLLAASDRFFLQHYLGPVDVGYYAAAYGIAIYVAEVMMVPLQLSFFPICMNLWSAEGKEATQKFLSRSFNYFILAGVLVVAGAIVTSREVLVVLASKKFQDARTLLPFLIFGLVVTTGNTFFRPGLLIQKRVSTIAKTVLSATVLNITLNIILLPRIGLIGAAIASSVSFLAMIVFTGYESMKVLPFRIEWLSIMRYVIVGAGSGWVASLLPIEWPLLAALVKGTVVVVLYTGTLLIIDGRVRQLAVQMLGLVRQKLKSAENASAEPLTAAAEN